MKFSFKKNLEFYISIIELSYLFLLLGLGYIFILGTAVWSAALNRWNIVLPTFLFLFVFVVILIIYAVKNFKKLIGKILSLVILLGLDILWITYILSPEKTWCIDFPAWNKALGIIGLVLSIFSLLSIIISIILKLNFKNSNSSSKKNSSRKKLNRTLICLSLISLFLSCAFATNWFNPYYKIIVPSKNEPPLKFTFWSHINVSYFSSNQLNELDEHKVILIAYDISERNYTYQWAQELRDNYPEIKLMFPIWGSYFELENDSNHYVNMVNDYLNAIEIYNLTNVIGFSFDLERQNDTCAHSKVLLNLAIDNLKKSIQIIRTSHPGYRIDVTGGIWMMFDKLPLGGSFELYKQHALMSITDWDFYAWQLYRGNAVDPQSDPNSTDIFERIYSSVKFLGANKTTPIFGMTGVGDYGPNNCSLNNISCNFQGLIRDCKIARALGVKEVQFYTLCDAGVYKNVYYPSMFEAYGEDFLDVLNESVNGLENPEILIIPGNTAFKTTCGYFWENVIYSINSFAFIIIFITALIFFIIKINYKSFNKKRSN